MKVVIAGSRGITSYDVVKKIIEASGYKITEVISGGAQGVDKLGERWAAENKIPVQLFPPDWEKHGKSAGFKRNAQMVEAADAAIVIHDGISKGTQHTYDLATKAKMPVYYVTVKKKSEFDPKHIDHYIDIAKKTPYIGSDLFISVLEYIKKNNV